MSKRKLETKIENLKSKDKTLLSQIRAIRAKYDRPTQWIKDEDYKAASRARSALVDELDELHRMLGEIEAQEWVARMEQIYHQGQV